jgi:endonuclease VIII
MAEGDTILRTARRIDAAIGGQTLRVRAVSGPGRAARIERLDGQRLERVESRGKHLLLHFAGLVLHSHLGMSGSWHVYRRGARWRKPLSAAWAVLRAEESEAVQFGGPTMRILSATQLRRDPVLARLGPDLLAPSFELDAMTHGFRTSPDRQLGDALLDQRLVAGIGNIFKSEACFAAGTDPWEPIATLADEQIERTLEAARRLMLESVESGRPVRAVYRRAGRPCPRCDTPIAVRGQGDANRHTYWCPRCQRRPPEGAHAFSTLG